MYQPELKYDQCLSFVGYFIIAEITASYVVLDCLARRLLKTRCRKKRNWLKKQKEQRCQHSESLQLSTEIPSRCHRSGNGTVRREPESVLPVTMLRNYTPPKGRKRRMLCQSLSMGSRLNSGPLTKWIGADWSAKCLSGAETLLSFSPSIENCMKLKPAN